MAEPRSTGEAELVLDPSEVADVRRWAAEQELDVIPVQQHGFEPITTVTLLVFGTMAGVSAVLYKLEQRRGGQVIDLTGPAPVFRRDPELVYGYIAVLAKDGTVTVELKEPKGMVGPVLDALRGTMSDLGKAGVDAIASSLKQVAGDARITVTPA